MSFAQKSLKRKNVKGLALTAGPRAPVPGIDTGAPDKNDRKEDSLEMGLELRLDFRNEDLIVLKELGAGNGGTVAKVQHVATKLIMARKIIHVEAKPEIQKRIVRELGIMQECNSPYIVGYYGAFMSDNNDVVMCMEYMNVGSLDTILKNFGPVRVDILGKIAEAVLGGLTYLYRAHRIMHRDIKPSNIVVNSQGQIKLCDFGVSSELENSIAATFVGTGTYMAPERIQGEPYTVKSDVWSVGLTLHELAIGKFPFGADASGEDAEARGIFDLLQQIVMEPSPELPAHEAFPSILHDMLSKCLLKDPKLRPTPQQLYEDDAFVQAAKNTPVNLQDWAVSMLERHQRKSHLPPPISHTQPTMQTLMPSTSRHTQSTVQPLVPSTSRNTRPTAQPPVPSTSRISAPAQSMHLSPQPPSRSADIPMAGLSLGTDPAGSEARPFPVRTSSVQNVSQRATPQLGLPRIARRPVGMMAPHSSADQRPLPKMPGDEDERMYN